MKLAEKIEVLPSEKYENVCINVLIALRFSFVPDLVGNIRCSEKKILKSNGYVHDWRLEKQLKGFSKQ